MIFTPEVECSGHSQRTTSWFHNNTRNLTASAGARGVLKIKPPPQPRKLQAWQAYYALTYQNRWKPHINRAWAEYVRNWTAENGNTKPPITRFQIMMEFMKKKFNEETEDMKNRCELYRKPDMRDKISPPPAKSTSDINTEYQK